MSLEPRGTLSALVPSKLNCPVRVPATALTLTAVRTAAEPPYAWGPHATVVADVHVLLPHTSLAVSETVAVGPAAPKLSPLIVTVPPALDAALLGLFPLNTGAATHKGHGNSNTRVGQQLKLSQAAENAPSKVKPRLAVLAKTLTQASRPAPTKTGAGAVQRSCVLVVHAVVAHGCPETYADGLKSLHWKSMPRTVTVVAPDTWAFKGVNDETLAGERNVG